MWFVRAIPNRMHRKIENKGVRKYILIPTNESVIAVIDKIKLKVKIRY